MTLEKFSSDHGPSKSPFDQITWTRKKREVRGQFFREDVFILDFRVRHMTLEKFSSDHGPSKSPFDQSPPLLLVSQRSLVSFQSINTINSSEELT
ncbi:hypothetical protein DAPPUDRAFT_234288 [Daphnia pulex]|uniref:Uncharacterized protein n=1 Tax=Daphnia pulex TaxID=6669 RepID=E9FY16_DAPPU|nr:hypothetical protein DAPPUDRAFT_234288 [Daphnia pulex]|eukprot:EFX88474.1 hypothetical protein DAPPUDRAFT_234288 [Daphnia pulex]